MFRLFPVGFISLSLRYPSEQNVLVKDVVLTLQGLYRLLPSLHAPESSLQFSLPKPRRAWWAC